MSQPMGSPRPGLQTRETEFEKPRGVGRIEVRPGFSQVHVAGLSQPVTTERMRVLGIIAETGVSIDFLKLTPDGLSFLVPTDKTELTESALRSCEVRYEVRRERNIVLVHAVNMRDEEGLIAEIVNTAISAGARMDHVGDMHDRLLLVVPSDQADALVGKLRERWTESA